MAGTIHRDPFRVLIRKIGYSVGLENALERVRDVVNLYAEERSLTSSGMATLIRSERHWKLRSDHVLEFLGALDLFKYELNSVFVLPTLDALAILRLQQSDADFDQSLRAVLLTQILSSDGDIFLNCLAAGYEKESVRMRLLAMVEGKRSLAKEAIGSPNSSEKVDRVVCIESQFTNRGGAVAGLGLSSLNRRENLGSARGPLADTSGVINGISEDYFRKVPPRRRDWARSLALVHDDGTANELGTRLLEHFTDLGQIVKNAFAFWPYQDELLPLNLREGELPWRTPGREAVLYGMKKVLKGTCFGQHAAGIEETEDWLRRVYSVYRSLSPLRSIVRVELPVRAARLVALGNACAADPIDYDPLKTALASEKAGGNIGFRPSRNNEGSIVIRRT